MVRLCVVAVVAFWVFALGLALGQVEIGENVQVQIESRDLTDLAWRLFETTWGDRIVRYTVLVVGSLFFLIRAWGRATCRNCRPTRSRPRT